MSSYNHCTFIGNLTRDTELRFTAQNKPVCNFGIAVNSGYGDKQTTLFLDCVSWGKTAEAVNQYCGKGSKVLVAGELGEDKWTDQQGVEKKRVKLTAFTVQFLDTKNKQQSAEPVGAASGGIDPDDVPF